MREPSIHISKSIFIKILEKEGVKISQSKIDSIFTTARNYSLDHRSILKNNKKNQKILSRRTQSTVGNANMLAEFSKKSQTHMRMIDGFYFSTRYPGDDSIEIDGDDVETCNDAIELCRKEVLELERKLKKDEV